MDFAGIERVLAALELGRCLLARVIEDRHGDEDLEDTPDLSISPDKVCYIIAKAREFDAKDVVTDPDDGSNPTDDAMVAVLEDHRDDPVVQEIAAAIFAMTEDEQIDLVTLAWLGRGDGSLEDWDELRAEAARAHNKRTLRICSACPSWLTISTRPWRSSAIRATSDSAAAAWCFCTRNLIVCFFSEAPACRSVVGTAKFQPIFRRNRHGDRWTDFQMKTCACYSPRGRPWWRPHFVLAQQRTRC